MQPHHPPFKELVARLKACHPSSAPPAFLDDLRVEHIFQTHGEFLAYYKYTDTDFVFDKVSHRYLVGIQGPHVPVLAGLYRYWTGDTNLDNHEAADQYVLQGAGFFKSRAGNHILIARSFAVPSELLSIRRDFEVLC